MIRCCSWFHLLCSEFLQQKWTKKNKLELAPNICYVISRFNEVSNEFLNNDGYS